jgi:Ice-binding-like
MTDLPTFAVLAATTITNTGPSVIKGNVGVYPGTSITGFPPGLAPMSSRANAQEAQEELAALWTSLPTNPSVDLSGKDLGGMTLSPGVYKFSSSAELTGILKLKAENPTDTFVFHIGSTLTTATEAEVVVLDEMAENVFWLVGSSATLGTGTVFAGKILAYASITLNDGVSVDGALWARTGAVTLDNNGINL